MKRNDLKSNVGRVTPMYKIIMAIFLLILGVLMLAILICPDYITNPVVTALTLRSWKDGYHELHHFESYRPYWWCVADDIVSYIEKPTLVIYPTAVLLAILGSCIYCLVRKLRKAHTPTPLSVPKARWKKKVAFGLLLLTIVLVRPNPVMSTLLMPLGFIKTSFSKWNVFGYSQFISVDNEVASYTLITGHLLRIYEYADTNDGFGLISNISNTFYQSRMILIAIFIAVARIGIVLRDKWAQPEGIPQEH